MQIGSPRGTKRQFKEIDRPMASTAQPAPAQASTCTLRFAYKDDWPVSIEVTGGTDEERGKGCALVRDLLEKAFPGMAPKDSRQEHGWTVQAPLHEKAATRTRRIAGELQACAEFARQLKCGSDLVTAILALPSGRSVAALLRSGGLALATVRDPMGATVHWGWDQRLPHDAFLHAAALGGLLMRHGDMVTQSLGARLLWALMERATPLRKSQSELRDTLVQGASREPAVQMSATMTQWIDLLRRGLDDGLTPDKQTGYAALAHALQHEAQHKPMTAPDVLRALAALTAKLPLQKAEATQQQRAPSRSLLTGLVDVTDIVTAPAIQAHAPGPLVDFDRSWKWLLSAWQEQQGTSADPDTSVLFRRSAALQEALFGADASAAVPKALAWARELGVTHPREAVNLLRAWPIDEETQEPLAVVERITLYVRFLRAHPSDSALRVTVMQSRDDVLEELGYLDDDDAVTSMALLCAAWEDMKAGQMKLHRAQGRDDPLQDFDIPWPEEVETRLGELQPAEPHHANPALAAPQTLPRFDLRSQADHMLVAVPGTPAERAYGQLLLRCWLPAALLPARGPAHIAVSIEGEHVRVAPAGPHLLLDAEAVHEAVQSLLACVGLAEMLGGGRSMLDALALHPHGPAIARMLAREVVRLRCMQDSAAATVVHWDCWHALPDGMARTIAQLSLAMTGHGEAGASAAGALLQAALQRSLSAEERQHLQLAALRLARGPAELGRRLAHAAETLQQLPLEWDVPTLDDWIGTTAEVLTRFDGVPRLDDGELAQAQALARQVIDRWLQQEASTQLDPCVLQRLVWPVVSLPLQRTSDKRTANSLIVLYQHAVAHPHGRQVGQAVLDLLGRQTGETAEWARAACADIDASVVKAHLARQGFPFDLRPTGLTPGIDGSFDPSRHAQDVIQYGLLVMEDLCTSVARFVASRLPQLPEAQWIPAARLLERAVRVNVSAPPLPGDPVAGELIAGFKWLQEQLFHARPDVMAAMSPALVQLLAQRFPQEALDLLQQWPDKPREDAVANDLLCLVSLARLHPDDPRLRHAVLQAKPKVKKYLDVLAREYFSEADKTLPVPARRQRMGARALQMPPLTSRLVASVELWVKWCLLASEQHVRAPRTASDFNIELALTTLWVVEHPDLSEASIVERLARIHAILDKLERTDEGERQEWVEELSAQIIESNRLGGGIRIETLARAGIDLRGLFRNAMRQFRLAGREDLAREIPIDWKLADCRTWSTDEANFLLRSHLSDNTANLKLVVSLPLRVDDPDLLSRCRQWLNQEDDRLSRMVRDVVQRLLEHPGVLSDPGGDADAACRRLAQECAGVLGPLFRYDVQQGPPGPGRFTPEDLEAAFSSLKLHEWVVLPPSNPMRLNFFKPPLDFSAKPLSAKAEMFRRAFAGWAQKHMDIGHFPLHLPHSIWSGRQTDSSSESESDEDE